jgi:hypothetical protein
LQSFFYTQIRKLGLSKGYQNIFGPDKSSLPTEYQSVSEGVPTDIGLLNQYADEKEALEKELEAEKQKHATLSAEV